MTTEELRDCRLFREIEPKDLEAMLNCLSAGRSNPSGATLS